MRCVDEMPLALFFNEDPGSLLFIGRVYSFGTQCAGAPETDGEFKVSFKVWFGLFFSLYPIFCCLNVKKWIINLYSVESNHNN